MHAPSKYMQRYKNLPWDRQVMAAMLSAVDDGIGNILKTLQKNEMLENTFIFFKVTMDHLEKAEIGLMGLLTHIMEARLQVLEDIKRAFLKVE